MQESTKISLTVIGTSLFTIALAAGTILVFHSQIKNKADRFFARHNHSVSGKDTPVSVRGGSIVVRAKDTYWNQNTDASKTYAYSAPIGLASKGEILARMQDFEDYSAYGLPWSITLISRTGDNNAGIMLCSEPDCRTDNGTLNDGNVYWVWRKPKFESIGPAEADDDGASDTSKPFHRGAYKYTDAAGQRHPEYEHISKIIITTSDTTLTRPCHNSACDVWIMNPPN